MIWSTSVSCATVFKISLSFVLFVSSFIYCFFDLGELIVINCVAHCVVSGKLYIYASYGVVPSPVFVRVKNHGSIFLFLFDSGSVTNRG